MTIEGATSEQSARMAAMDNSSKNAGEMIDKLRLKYNRTRQAKVRVPPAATALCALSSRSLADHHRAY
jgi:hypothetical protein